MASNLRDSQESGDPEMARPKLQPRFVGKVALVTGASNRGLGGAIARRLSREGAAVAVLTNREPKKLMQRIERSGAQFSLTVGDVRDNDSIQRAIDETMEQFGQIDLVVNNAGLEYFRRLDEMTDEAWQNLLDVNLTGVMKVTRAVLPYLPQPGGVVVNVASALALGGCEGFTAYSASKAGLIGFTQSLAMELAPRRQRVVAVAPALVLSPMSREYLGATTQETWRRVQACHPLDVGLPEDVAAAVAFLASEEARWITGITLPLGWSPGFPLPTDAFMQ